jgi:hypothetical protein
MRAYIENMEKENTWKEIWRDLNKKFGETICQKQNSIEELEKQMISESRQSDTIHAINFVLKSDIKKLHEELQKSEKQIISKSLEYDMIYGANIVLKNDAKRLEGRLRKSDNSIVLLSEKYQILKSNNDSSKQKTDLSSSKEEMLIYPVAPHKRRCNSDKIIDPVLECHIIYDNELDRVMVECYRQSVFDVCKQMRLEMSKISNNIQQVKLVKMNNYD